MYYSPFHAQSKVIEGSYKPSVRTFVMKKGALANTHYTAIPFNAPNKAGALVITNILLSPEAQIAKADPTQWGDLMALDFSKLEQKYKTAYEALDFGAATLDPQTLLNNAVPEIDADYLELLEAGWEENVLKK